MSDEHNDVNTMSATTWRIPALYKLPLLLLFAPSFQSSVNFPSTIFPQSFFIPISPIIFSCSITYYFSSCFIQLDKQKLINILQHNAYLFHKRYSSLLSKLTVFLWFVAFRGSLVSLRALRVYLG